MADRQITKALQGFSRAYDNNEFAKGLKHVTSFLKQYPNCAEGIAWKGLFLQSNKKPKEATEAIAEAIRKDMKNPRIWKLQGIILREQGDYTKALQSFSMSYRNDPKDDSILFELCNLLLYERNYSQFLQHSYKLLNTMSSANTVVRYALALHLTGRIQKAIDWLNLYENNFLPNINEDEILFRTELFLYQGQLYIEAGLYQEGIEFLQKNFDFIRDKVSVYEQYLTCHINLNNKEEALKDINFLVDYYPENGDYYQLLEKITTRDEYLQHLFDLKPKSRYAQVRILELLDPQDVKYRDYLKEYLSPYIIKGAPSLFITVAELSKEQLVIAKEIVDQSQSQENFPITSVPIIKLFDANYYISQHDYENALKSVEEALHHTPTCIEALALKLKILTLMGRIEESCQAASAYAEADPNDRNSNTCYIKALLRNGKLKTAFSAAQPFSIDSNKHPKLLLTQYNNFHLRVAYCTYRAKNYKDSTKFYQDVLKHFEDFRKSQFNYVSWGMKHIHSLYDMLKWADDLPKHPVLAKGLLGLMKLHFLNKNEVSIKSNKELAEVALKATFSESPGASAYAAIYFSLNDEPLPALKCLNKIQGPWKYAAMPAITKMMTHINDPAYMNQKKRLPDIVIEVANQYYKLAEAEFKEKYTGPSTFLEKIYQARAKFIIADNEAEVTAAKNSLMDAVKNCEYDFKSALDAYTIANNEMNDEAFGKQVNDAVHAKYPAYQMIFEYEPSDIPVEIDDD